MLGYEKLYGEEFVHRDDALEYAMEKCGVVAIDDTAPEAEEFKEMLVEWYFSDWVEVDD